MKMCEQGMKRQQIIKWAKFFENNFRPLLYINYKIIEQQSNNLKFLIGRLFCLSYLYVVLHLLTISLQHA